MMNLPIRPRRNRKSAAVRGLMRETTLSAANLIYPMFVQEGAENTPIESLPGCSSAAVSASGLQHWKTDCIRRLRQNSTKRA